MRFPSFAAVSAAALTAGVVLITGCGSAEGDGDKDGVPAARTGTLEELAAMATCKPDVQIDADELRQGMCRTDSGRYVLTTFSTAKGQHDWLEEAKPYGGFYLVGKKWIAVGEPDVLGGLRGTLGGTVEKGTNHTSGHDSGGKDGGKQHGGGHQ